MTDADPDQLPDEDLEPIAQVLQHQADHERRVLAEAARPDAPGAETVAAFMAARRAELTRPATGTRRPWLWAAAAVVAIALGVWAWQGNQPANGPPRLLGHGEIKLLTPVKDGASFERFAWSQVEVPDTEVVYDIEVRDALDATAAPRLGRSRTTSWSPSPPLPDTWIEIEWTVRALQEGAALGAELAVGTAHVRRGT